MVNKKISADRKFFNELCRTNTGSHMLDSGSHYGYQYEKPLSENDIIINTEEDEKGRKVLESMYIHLPAFLENNFERNTMSKRIEKVWFAWVDENDSWDIEEFLNDMNERKRPKGLRKKVFEVVTEKLDNYIYVGSDNTYNSENDLDQDMMYYIIATEDDWYYSSETIFFVVPHCGCDIRGGYPCPIPVFYYGEESCFMDMTVGLFVTDEEGREHNKFHNFQVGYSSNPQYTISTHEDVDYILLKDDYNMILVLKDGTELKCSPDVRLY